MLTNTSEITGIQFSILSPDEIRRGSVAEITSRDTYINNKPVIGGLFDPRMGVLEPGLICPVDGLDYISSPGYFGHIELSRPVYYFQYVSTIQKILKCVCFKCSKLLISKKKYERLLKNDSGEARWLKICGLCSKVKYCGEHNDNSKNANNDGDGGGSGGSGGSGGGGGSGGSGGCGFLQPSKIKKENIATLVAEWDKDKINSLSDDTSDTVPQEAVVKLSTEMVLKLLSRISDDDVKFMGFSPVFSHPAWMICQALAVPPPAVRPSIKHDTQQRSEDDISHIIVNIIKANSTLKNKIRDGAPINIIDDWTNMLQYFISTLVDNKIPGIGPVAQRSGRPLKAIKERLSGKAGRVRGNLMGKRVDFSARSVITPDPNLSIKQLGIPLKVAKNITKPITVNNSNKHYLLKLIENGSSNYPGANVLQKKNGDSISLKYVDLKSIKLETGDIVHRHIMDGDAVLFNRQPTLHRMSMMCHIAKVLKVGDTFRMNVGDTKPYNADFDGDEMNMHMPQDLMSEIELKTIANVCNQIVSPAQNNTIVGIFQDSLLGIYNFTKNNLKITKQKTMNLLARVPVLDINLMLTQLKKHKSGLSGHHVLTHILGNVSLKYKTAQFKDNEDFSKSKNVLEINNGEFVRGFMDKKVLGSASTGIIHRICNDAGNEHAANFIDNLQNIVTEFMQTDGYSVGMSDLISNKETDNKINVLLEDYKKKVNDLIDATHLNVFRNMTGRTNSEEFENQANTILNSAGSEAGKIGRQSLSTNNRFVIMVNAGSKGSELNISQMISCLGQVSVDGKRIPYGFDHRTLPHYTKFDDSPGARGFVENSFIKGLSPQELFFHAMGGRTGLIDTAVKTSQTGYIQRRLVKGMEDLKICYDNTVRNNKNKIVQYAYGDDGFDTTKVENQNLPLLHMNIDQIYQYFSFTLDDSMKLLFTQSTIKAMNAPKFTKEFTNWQDKTVDFMVKGQHDIIEHVFDYSTIDKIHCPLSFHHLIDNVKNSMHQEMLLVDLTPLDAIEKIEHTYFEILEKITINKPNRLFKILYFYYLNPISLLTIKKFNNQTLTILLEQIVYYYKKSLVMPGEMVGILAAQSIGEPTTQMTLNTFHLAGVASKSNVTRGVPRVEEILSLSDNPKNPSMTIYLKKSDQNSREKAHHIMNMIEETRLRALITNLQICYEPNEFSTSIAEDVAFVNEFNDFEKMINEFNNEETTASGKSKWIIRLTLSNYVLIEKNITLDDIDFCLKSIYQDSISTTYSDYNANNIVFRIKIDSFKKTKLTPNDIDQSDEICYIKSFAEQLMDNVSLRGIKDISKVTLRKDPTHIEYKDGKYQNQQTWLLDTVGSNLLNVLALDFIDSTKTHTNKITEIYRTLGIEAARQSIYNEFSFITTKEGTYINTHHLGLLADRMTYSYKMISIFRHGINNDDIGPIAKASFEETPEMFLKAAKFAEMDDLMGISSNVMCGQLGNFGTNSFQVLVDHHNYPDSSELDDEDRSNSELHDIMQSLTKIDEDEYCSSNNMRIQQHASLVQKQNINTPDDAFNIDF